MRSAEGQSELASPLELEHKRREPGSESGRGEQDGGERVGTMWHRGSIAAGFLRVWIVLVAARFQRRASEPGSPIALPE